MIATETVEIYNEDGLLSGFCVSLERDNQPSGYVVIQFNANEPVISEYTTDENAKNIYDEILKTTNRADTQSEKKIYSFLPNEYVIPQNENGQEIYVGFSGEILDADAFELSKEDAKEIKAYMRDAERAERETRNQSKTRQNQNEAKAEIGIIYEPLSVQTRGGKYDHSSVFFSDSYSGTVSASKNIPGYNSFTIYGSDDVDGFTKEYACSVVAMLNLVSYVSSNGYNGAFLNNSANDTYTKLYELAGTTGSSTYSDKIKPALVNYFKGNTRHRCSVDEYWFTYYSDFTRDLNNNKPCMIGVSYNKPGGGESGHQVFVVGYVQTSTDNYLRVTDGWDNTKTRYFN